MKTGLTERAARSVGSELEAGLLSLETNLSFCGVLHLEKLAGNRWHGGQHQNTDLNGKGVAGRAGSENHGVPTDKGPPGEHGRPTPVPFDLNPGFMVATGLSTTRALSDACIGKGSEAETGNQKAAMSETKPQANRYTGMES